MSSPFLADDERSLLLMRIKELEERHTTFRDSVVCAFNQLLDLKDISTGVHSTRLAEWAIRAARKLASPQECLYQAEVAALLPAGGQIGGADAVPEKAREPPRWGRH